MSGHTSWSEYRAARQAQMTGEDREYELAAKRLLAEHLIRYQRSRLYRLKIWWSWRDVNWLNLKARLRGR